LGFPKLAYSLVALTLCGTIAVTASQMSAATPPITDANGQLVPGSIASMETVRLGGVDQWVIIRGRSTQNPLLLFLSGGPGGSEIGWLRHYNAALEDSFTVVIWEQRGTGKSASLVFADYGRLTPEQYTADGLELTGSLRQRFGQDKIYLMGKSWGTMLGVWMVQQRPEWFAAFIGSGQMTNPVQDDVLGYQYVLLAAQLGTSAGVIYYWIEHSQLAARRTTTGRLCIPYTAEIDAECRQRVADSPHMNRHPKTSLGAAGV
jgi:pimeloyl-ACP methyl ester carboxylesterase